MIAAIDILKNSNPDIVCLQELDSELISLLEPGLESVVSRAHVSLNESLPSRDGLGIYFNPGRFKVVDTSTARFGVLMDKYIPSLGDAARMDNTAFSLTRALYREIREKLNMAVIVRLRELDSGKEVVVGSSHLFWDPSYPDIKLIQAYILAQEIMEFAGDSALVIGADLNSIAYSSAVYELLMGSGTVDVSHSDHPVSLRPSRANSRLSGVQATAVPDLHLARPFRSAMKKLLGAEPAFTNYTSGFKGCLDYIMTNDGISPVWAQPLPSESELSVETALPNSKYPSDHLPLVVDLDWSS
jgi:mRNA deadenylase 3'-5' endonuclease subunit Ccr4